MCKGFDDTHQMMIVPFSSKYTAGMTEWIKRMRKDKEWTEGTIETNMFMVCAHLSTVAMKTGRNNISQYGAVRMTKAEA
eukprot:349099-Heterocapsa_arctica.AAC.1